MLVVPHVGKLSTKNLPYITIILILLNALIYFGLQGSEGRYYQEAEKFYQYSGLIKLETAAYLNYLQETAQKVKLFPLRKLDPAKASTQLRIARTMFSDQPFMAKLKGEEIISPGAAEYVAWKKLHGEMAEILGKSISMSYGYRPAKGTLLTSFTYMFLHGSPMHLIGNMVFLWLVGCMIELACGRTVYLAIYLLTGIISALFFGLIYKGTTVPLVGASGAIAGLMGFYTILFGKKKVGIFLSVGFYFTNMKVPAIILLPFWIGNELYQLFLGGASNVAYVGHLGGLISGAAGGLTYLRFFGGLPAEAASDEERAERLATIMEEGLRNLSDLEFARARESFEAILREEPGNLKALRHLYQLDSQNPAAGSFHASAGRLITLLARNQVAEAECLEIYRHYLQKAGSPKLPVDASLVVNRILLKKGCLQESTAIITFLLKTHPASPELPGCLLSLAKAYLRLDGGRATARKCLQVICSRYQTSPEFVTAQAILHKAEQG